MILMIKHCDINIFSTTFIMFILIPVSDVIKSAGILCQSHNNPTLIYMRSVKSLTMPMALNTVFTHGQIIINITKRYNFLGGGDGNVVNKS